MSRQALRRGLLAPIVLALVTCGSVARAQERPASPSSTASLTVTLRLDVDGAAANPPPPHATSERPPGAYPWTERPQVPRARARRPRVHHDGGLIAGGSVSLGLGAAAFAVGTVWFVGSQICWAPVLCALTGHTPQPDLLGPAILMSAGFIGLISGAVILLSEHRDHEEAVRSSVRLSAGPGGLRLDGTF